MPPGISFSGPEQPVGEIAFLADKTYVDSSGRRHVDQQIFDAVLDIVGTAERFILLDMFLYNSFLGEAPEPIRRLSQELTDALIERKRTLPQIEIIVITDPINVVYGGLDSGHFERLREHDIAVVNTELDVLRDSNPVYSLFWRIFVRPFGNAEGDLMPNPFGPGRVSLRSYLSLLNFKANHRKTIVADRGESLVGLVTSANAHDASAAHTNVAIRFDGPAVRDLVTTENAVLEFSGAEPLALPGGYESGAARGDLSVQVLTERKIKVAVLDALGAAGPGDSVSLAMFYLSDRDVIGALEAAGERGADMRILLDPNKDAFGRQKNGIPARPVARELVAAGLPVRWCDTHGEQCHMKMLLVDYADGRSFMTAGSANLTRRNLENYNLETNVAVRGPAESDVFADARGFFDLMWLNEPERRFSVDYEAYADESLLKRALYRFMETSGISTF